MKSTFTSILLCSLLFSVTTNAQAVNKTDSLALVDLYNSTKGANWFQHTNWLTGPVSSWYGITVEGNRVTRIGLTYNNVNGPLPETIGNLTALQYFEMNINPMSGTLPSTIGKLTNLVSLYMYSCHLTGEIPASIGNLKKLNILVLHNNNFSGSIPGAIGKLQNLSALYLYSNKLSGNLPTSIFRNTVLSIVDVSKNQLSLDYNVSYTTAKRPMDLNVSNNNFNFNGLEYMSQITSTTGLKCKYKSQAQLSIQQHQNTLAVSAGGTLAYNTYEWFKVGEAASTIIKADSSYSPKTNGAYYVRVTNKIAKALVLESDTIVFNAVKPLPLSVYPNPAKDVITINKLNAHVQSK